MPLIAGPTIDIKNATDEEIENFLKILGTGDKEEQEKAVKAITE